MVMIYNMTGCLLSLSITLDLTPVVAGYSSLITNGILPGWWSGFIGKSHYRSPVFKKMAFCQSLVLQMLFVVLMIM